MAGVARRAHGPRYRAGMRPVQLSAISFAVVGVALTVRGDQAQGVAFLVLAIGLYFALGSDDDAEGDEEDAR